MPFRGCVAHEWVAGMVWSADGAYAALDQGGSGLPIIYDTLTWKSLVRWSLPYAGPPGRRLAFSADGWPVARVSDGCLHGLKMPLRLTLAGSTPAAPCRRPNPTALPVRAGAATRRAPRTGDETLPPSPSRRANPPARLQRALLPYDRAVIPYKSPGQLGRFGKVPCYRGVMAVGWVSCGYPVDTLWSLHGACRPPAQTCQRHAKALRPKPAKAKAGQSHPQATCEPSTWEERATHKPPSCDPHATLKPPPSQSTASGHGAVKSVSRGWFAGKVIYTGRCSSLSFSASHCLI